jgi:hypothetical protein
LFFGFFEGFLFCFCFCQYWSLNSKSLTC